MLLWECPARRVVGVGSSRQNPGSVLVYLDSAELETSGLPTQGTESFALHLFVLRPP